MKGNASTGLIIAAIIIGAALFFSANQANPHSYQKSGVGFPAHSISGISAHISSGITVSGAGEVEMPADQAVISVRIESKADNAAKSQDLNADATDSVYDALKDAGINKKDIETSSFSIREDKTYDRNSQQYISNGFIATHILKVTIEDVGNTGRYIDAATKGGATGIDFVSFTLKKETQKEARDEAISKAVKLAEEKADIIADSSGVKRGNVISISESSFSIASFQRSVDMIAVAESAVKVSPGDVSVQASVSVKYAIRQ